MDNTLLNEDQNHGTMPTPSQDTTSSVPSASAKAPIPLRIDGDAPHSPSSPSDSDSYDNSPDNGSNASTAASTIGEQEEDHDPAKQQQEQHSYPLPPPTTIPTKVLDQDKNTPDSHVPRDPRLIRLTGIHPFNVEPPLTDLYKEGFLTSPELFYVRNHGAVPQVQDEDMLDWEFSVEG